MKKARIIKRTLFYICTLCIVCIFSFPFFWMVLSSSKYTVDIIDTTRIFDFTPTSHNYDKVINYGNILVPLKNSIIIAVVSTSLSLFLGLQTAYSVARNKQRKVSAVILLIRIIPIITFLVPWYRMFSKLKMVGSYTCLILTHMIMALPFIVWIMTPYFEALPKELEEAAVVDGCSHIGTFYRIMLPLAVPGIVTTTIMTFVSSWNNFMFSLVFSGANTLTLPMAIYQFLAYEGTDWGCVMADAVLTTAPIIVLSLFLQKYVVQGLSAGAVKS